MQANVFSTSRQYRKYLLLESIQGTILNVSSVGEPASERDGGDLETGAAKEPILHLGKPFGNRHLGGVVVRIVEFANALSSLIWKNGVDSDTLQRISSLKMIYRIQVSDSGGWLCQRPTQQ